MVAHRIGTAVQQGSSKVAGTAKTTHILVGRFLLQCGEGRLRSLSGRGNLRELLRVHADFLLRLNRVGQSGIR